MPFLARAPRRPLFLPFCNLTVTPGCRLQGAKAYSHTLSKLKYQCHPLSTSQPFSHNSAQVLRCVTSATSLHRLFLDSLIFLRTNHHPCSRPPPSATSMSPLASFVMQDFNQEENLANWMGVEDDLPAFSMPLDPNGGFGGAEAGQVFFFETRLTLRFQQTDEL
jgi:hypothetical protein